LKLLLDEMYTAAVAEQLRQRDHDVIAVAERADLRGTPDEDLLAWARTEDRALVTDNQRDFIPIHHRWIAANHDHRGLILTTNRRFPRVGRRTLPSERAHRTQLHEHRIRGGIAAVAVIGCRRRRTATSGCPIPPSFKQSGR